MKGVSDTLTLHHTYFVDINTISIFELQIVKKWRVKIKFYQYLASGKRKFLNFKTENK